MLVRVIVSNHLTNYTAYQPVQNTMTVAGLGEDDRRAFVAALELQLAGLNPENLAAYGLPQSDFDRWAPGWKSNLGIIDVLGPGGHI